MQDLVTIGRFAQRSQLTVKALRLYDKLGILHPAVVDFSSGYRYYSLEQRPVAQRIHLLRSLDMPLEDIRTLLQTKDHTEARALLIRHRRRLEERLSTSRRALRRLETLDQWYGTVEREESMECENKPYQCSFCGKPHTEVRRIIAGPKGVFICDECVAKCNQILATEEARSSA